MPQGESYDMIVIGAGISGMSLANLVAQSGKKVLVFEASDKIGGCLNTHYHADNDFWVEMGAHTFYATYATLIDLIQKNGLNQDVIGREKVGMKVFTDQHEKIMKPVSKWELLTSVPNMFFSKREGKTVREYFGKIVGKKNYNKIFKRMFSAVIVQNADKFSAEYFLKRRKTKSKEHPKSFILKKGMSSLIQALADNENIKIKTSCSVQKLNKTENGFIVVAANGEEFVAKDIALAATTGVNARLLDEVNSELSQLLSEFPVQSIESKVIVLPKEQLSFDPVSFIIPLQGPCFSMVTRDVMTHDKVRGFAFHFEENQISEKEQKKFMSDLLCLQSLETDVFEAKHKLPLLKIGHRERILKMNQLAEQSGIYLTGNYFNGLSLEDCVERSKQEFERYTRNVC